MRPRVALLADHLEEGWTSMDHYVAKLARWIDRAGRFEPSVIRPEFHHRLGRFPGLFGPRHARTVDRYLNRYLDYPRAVARVRDFDLYHVIDQTYAHAVQRLPPGRTVITCHDVDFVNPPAGTRHAWLVRRTGALSLPGLRCAARVVCVSEATRLQLLRLGLVEPERLRVVQDGVEDEFAHEGARESRPELEALLAKAGKGPVILHVGAMLSRKRLDLVLKSFAAILKALPGATLVRAGGSLSPAMLSLAELIGVEQAIVTMPFLSRAELAALYRRADLFLLCSETEGFCMPVLEAMACGVPVVTRDLAAIREVAGDAVRHVPGADPEAFATAALEVLRDETVRRTMRQRGIERAAHFRWTSTATRMEEVYQELLESLKDRPAPPSRARGLGPRAH